MPLGVGLEQREIHVAVPGPHLEPHLDYGLLRFLLRVDLGKPRLGQVVGEDGVDCSDERSKSHGRLCCLRFRNGGGVGSSGAPRALTCGVASSFMNSQDALNRPANLRRVKRVSRR